MLETFSSPTYLQMNLAHTLSNSVSIYWFAEKNNTLERISEVVNDTIQWEYQNEFERSAAIQISLLAPCQIVIVEIPTEGVNSSSPKNQLDYYTSLFDHSIRHGTHPIIICLGNQVPAEQVIEWLKLGIFTYAETSSDSFDILQVIEDAKKHASKMLSKYVSFKRLLKIWNSIAADELTVMEMIFEGLPNKTIASRLKVSQRTIEARRHRIFEKFGSKSLPIIVRRICEWHQLKQEFRGQDFE